LVSLVEASDGRLVAEGSRTALESEHGKAVYRKRIQMIEPVFAHTKHTIG
jgi:hypothetical protein